MEVAGHQWLDRGADVDEYEGRHSQWLVRQGRSRQENRRLSREDRVRQSRYIIEEVEILNTMLEVGINMPTASTKRHKPSFNVSQNRQSRTNFTLI